MTKLLATCAALAITAAFAMPGPAFAAGQRTDGARNMDQGQIEVSARRKQHRSHVRHNRGHVRHYYGPRHRYGYARPRYYDAPYYAYAPRPYYRPSYGPSVGVGVGPFGFGFGFR